MTEAYDRRSRVGLTIAVAILYVATSSPYIVDGDNAEFAALAGRSGAAHPPGYPLYLLWLRATAWIPGSSIAHTSAIGTAVLGVLGVWVLHRACRAWGASPLAATLAAGMYATAPIVMGTSTSAEVFALNQLVVATILWLVATAGPLRGARRTIALAAVAGLGLSDHLTCGLLVGLGTLGAVRGLRETTTRKPLVILGALGAFAIGLLPYLYLLVPPDDGLGWGNPSSFGDVLHHFLRMDYGGPGAFASHGSHVDVAGNLALFAATIGGMWWWLPLAGGLGWWVARGIWPAATGESRLAWILLGGTFLVAGPLLTLRFNVPLVGFGPYVARRFHLLPAILLAPAVACALDWAGGMIARRVRVPVFGAWLVASVAVVTSAALRLPHLAAVHSPATETSIANLLRALPPEAVVIHSQDVMMFGGQYLQVREGVRPDVVLVAWPTMTSSSYHQYIAARLGRSGGQVAAVAAGGSLGFVEQQLAAGRAVFVDESQRNALTSLPSYPYGTVFRVLPRGTPPPAIEQVFADNKAVFEKFDVGYELPGVDDDFATAAHERYAVTWRVIGRALDRSGRHDQAQEAFAIARALGPRS
ncbi:MAG: DUF2723 domain-containing protein [Proteobacteria bacterium]|nr:DUF2723 domain-containing protein [Pseudomonadota bacterium]